MWCYDPAGKRVSADQGKHCHSFAGCWNHECKVCQWHAAGKTGTGIRKVWLKPFDKNNGKLDHKLCRPVSGTALWADEGRILKEQIHPLRWNQDPGDWWTRSERIISKLDVGISDRSLQWSPTDGSLWFWENACRISPGKLPWRYISWISDVWWIPGVSWTERFHHRNRMLYPCETPFWCCTYGIKKEFHKRAAERNSCISGNDEDRNPL